MNKVIKESREVIIDKTAKYLHWLTIPKSEFGNMPVCPFLEKEMRDDMLYLDIWYPHESSFMDIMESFLLSNKNSALVICPNTCLLYTSPSPRDATLSRMPSSA